MSGIVGMWNLDGRRVEHAVLTALSAPMAHRGPDGEGRWVQGPVGLACQLFRVTPESATETQPLVGSSGAVLVFDGRLDNREDLLASLKTSQGVRPDSPDPALVLGAYEAFGDRFPERLNGDFALGLFDHRRRQLLLARDAMGVRPLYYCRTRETFLFASEIKALLAHPLVSRRPDDDQLAEFLLGGPARDNQGFTFFRGVSSVLPGYFVIATPQEFAARRYWDFDATRRTRLGSFQEYAAGFRYHFEQAVRRRLRSAHAVALGVSGGLDSSSNFCVAQALMRRDSYQRSRLLGLSYTFAEGSPPDEQAYLLEIERAYGIAIQRIHTRPMGPLEGSGGEVWHVEAPLLDGEWHNTHMFHQTAHRLGARVLLTGQWGDNMLFDQAYLLDLFHRRAWGTIGTHLKEFRHWMTDVDPKHFRRRFFRDLVRSHVPTVLVPLLRKLHTQFLGRTRHLAWYNAARLKGQLASQQSVSKRTFNSAHARALYGEARSRYNVLSMEWNNKAASMHGLEIAFPFLDRDLVAFLMGIPGDMQTWKGVPKAILREAMRGVVPDAILDRRRKADFTDLINEGMERDYPQLVHCLLSEGMAVRLGYVRGDVLGQELGRLKDGLKSSDCRAAWSLSGLLGLELWLQVFFGENTNGKGGVYASAC